MTSFATYCCAPTQQRSTRMRSIESQAFATVGRGRCRAARSRSVSVSSYRARAANGAPITLHAANRYDVPQPRGGRAGPGRAPRRRRCSTRSASRRRPRARCGCRTITAASRRCTHGGIDGSPVTKDPTHAFRSPAGRRRDRRSTRRRTSVSAPTTRIRRSSSSPTKPVRSADGTRTSTRRTR